MIDANVILFYPDTTDIQNAEVTVHGKSVVVECQYLDGSEARGCYIELTFPNGTHYQLVNASRNATANISLALPAHCYNIQVYYWEADGTIGNVSIPVSDGTWNVSCLLKTPPSSASGMHSPHFPLLQLFTGGLLCMFVFYVPVPLSSALLDLLLHCISAIYCSV